MSLSQKNSVSMSKKSMSKKFKFREETSAMDTDNAPIELSSSDSESDNES